MKRERIENLVAYCGLQDKHTEVETIKMPVYIATTMSLGQKRALSDQNGTHEKGYVHKITIEKALVTKINDEMMILYSGEITINEIIHVGMFEDSITRLDRTIL